MPWPLGTDPEEKLQLELIELLGEAGVRSQKAFERRNPKIPIVIVSANELRSAIPHIDSETGKRCSWQ